MPSRAKLIDLESPLKASKAVMRRYMSDGRSDSFPLIECITFGSQTTEPGNLVQDIVVGKMQDLEDHHVFPIWVTGVVSLIIAWYVLHGSYHAEEYWCGMGIYAEEKLATKNVTGYQPEAVYWQCLMSFRGASVGVWTTLGLAYFKTLLYLIGTTFHLIGVSILITTVLFQSPELIAIIVTILATGHAGRARMVR